MLLKHGNESRGRTANEKTLFTIHNLAYQGIFTPTFPLTNLPGECFHYTRLEYFNQINCLKGGLAECDLITTVSETYARKFKRKNSVVAWNLTPTSIWRFGRNHQRSRLSGMESENRFQPG